MLIEWCFTLLLTVFQSYHSDSSHYSCFPVKVMYHMVIYVWERVENFVRKGENAGTSIFSFSHSVFKTLVTRDISCWDRSVIGLRLGYLCKHGWLIVWCLMLFSTVFQLYHCGQCTNRCFPGVLLTNTQHNILSKPLAAFIVKTKHSGERGMNPDYKYQQSSEKILAEPVIEPATSCSQVCNATDQLHSIHMETAK